MIEMTCPHCQETIHVDPAGNRRSVLCSHLKSMSLVDLIASLEELREREWEVASLEESREVPSRIDREPGRYRRAVRDAITAIPRDEVQAWEAKHGRDLGVDVLGWDYETGEEVEFELQREAECTELALSVVESHGPAYAEYVSGGCLPPEWEKILAARRA